MSQFDHIIHHPPASFVEQATVAGMDAVSGQPVPHGICHEGAIFAQISAARMDIAIHQAKGRGGWPARGGNGADDVHAKAPSRNLA